jgi:hypothetical protein
MGANMDYMRDKGAAVLQNGYPLIPLVVGEKRPAIDGWRNVEATEQIIAGWTGGIGIRTGTVLFIDIDIPNPVADRLRQVCRELLGPAPIRIGRAPKLGMMYRAAAIFKTRLSTVYRDPDKNRCAIEALADGRQFVAWNIHPDTGQPYYWLEGLTPETLPLSELTVVTEAQVTQLFQAFDRIALEEGWGRLSGAATGWALLPATSCRQRGVASRLACPTSAFARRDWRCQTIAGSTPARIGSRSAAPSTTKPAAPNLVAKSGTNGQNSTLATMKAIFARRGTRWVCATARRRMSR